MYNNKKIKTSAYTKENIIQFIYCLQDAGKNVCELEFTESSIT